MHSNPMHDQCPDGPESWCKSKLDKDNYKHRHGLPLPVRDFIRPVFKDLADEELLKKCLHGKTQNANECLNKLIWDRCNKETYVAVPVIEDATYSAVAYFNDGASSILKVMRELGIEPGRFPTRACCLCDKVRIKNSNRNSSEQKKQRRKTIRAMKKGFGDKLKEKGGNVYEKGAH